MKELFEIASQVSSPLALGGLVATIFFLILRQIVAKNIFPELTKAVGGDILKLIIERLFILALIAMFLGFIGYLFTATLSATGRYKGSDSISVTLPDKMTLQEATKRIAEIEHFAVNFKESCDEATLKAEVRGGQLKGRGTVALIEQLRFRLKDPGIRLNYRVTKLEDQNVYEIACR